MSAAPTQIILGSRSPRRAELLRLVIVVDRVRVLPPASSEELGFDGLHNWAGIENRLSEVAHNKCDEVLKQLDQRSPDDRDQFAAVVTADTIIVADDGDGRLVVLGQPPETDSWRDVVRGWFHRYYLGRTHTAATAFCIATPTGIIVEKVVTTRVTFRPDDSETRQLVEWYLDTGEPRGKAGGYALQGAGGLFVSAVEGSISNVVGLPLRELLNAFIELDIDVAAIDH